MKFLDVFPYDKNEYSQVIDYFEKSIGIYFQKILSEFSKGIVCNLFPSCCLNLPHGDDNVMRKGPFVWSGCPILKRGEEDLSFWISKCLLFALNLQQKFFI